VAILAAVIAQPVGAQQRSPSRSAAPASQQSKPPVETKEPGKPTVDLIYSPWTKFCASSQERNSRPVCFTGREARLETGMTAAAAVLIEPDKDPKKVLRITLPLGMQLAPGTRIVIDQDRPLAARYLICTVDGCLAEFEVNRNVINRLKRGKQLAVQAINANGQAISVNLPLDDFAKVYDGPPTDPRVFEEQEKKRVDDLERRVNEARQTLERLTGGAR
jgi:invasion protein IalB